MSEITIPGFDLERTLGAGGFGTVWLARQPSVDRLVAIKIGHRKLQDAAARTRFERECQALGRLTGRSDIVEVHVTGALPDGRPYLVLEYVEGGTLWDRIEHGPLTEPEITSIGQQLCAALDHAHRADILHRDIKPENVFLRADGSVVLGDFGIAAADNSDVTRSAGLTATIPYTAPEVLGGQRATTASDLYAVGATTLSAATRTVPFVDENDAGLPALLNRVLEGNLPDIRTLGFSDGLASVVERLLAPDPASRPGSAAEAGSLFAAVSNPAEGWAAPTPETRTVIVPPIGPSTPPSPAPVVQAAAAGPAGTVPGSGGAGGRRRGSLPMVLGALTGVLLLVVGLGFRSLTAGDRGTESAAGADGADVGSPVAAEGVGSTTTTVDTGPPTSSESSGTGPSGGPDDTLDSPIDPDDIAAATTTTDAPALAPIDIPLSPADVGLPSVNAVELVLDADRMGFCRTPIDLSGTTEVRTVLINDFDGNDQVAQQAIQFVDEDAADAFMEEVAASLTCSSWPGDTVDGTQNYTSEAVEIVPAATFGDDTKAWDGTTTFENGFVVRQRSYMMRRHDRVVGVFVVSDEPDRLELATTFLALMVDRLGYDT